MRKVIWGIALLCSAAFAQGPASIPNIATALAATPTKCSPGSYTLGIDVLGNAQSCTALATVATSGSASDLGTGTLPHARLPTLLSGDIPNNAANTSGQANTALALAAAPTPCAAGNYPLGVDVNGNSLNCTAVSSVGPSSRKGSVIVSYTVGTLTANLQLPVGGEPESVACSANPNVFWPTAGYFRSVALATVATNTQTNLRANLNIDCQNGNSGAAPGGAVVPPLAAAGGYVDASTADYYHANQGSAPFFAFMHSGTASTAGVSAISAEFVDDAGAYASVLGATFNTATTASSTRFWGFAGGGVVNSATELAVAIPVPFAATAGNLTLCTSAGPPTVSIPVTFRQNGANTAKTFTIGSTNVAAGCYSDTSHPITLAAGDYINLQAVTGGTTQSTVTGWYQVITPTSGTATMLGGIINTTVTTSNNFAPPGGSVTGATIANEEVAMPIACTASNLYVVQATANSGVTTTFTLEKNGADTAITGTITSATTNVLGGTGTGSMALDTTHSVSYAKGDLMTLKYVTASGTSGTIGGWSIQCQ